MQNLLYENETETEGKSNNFAMLAPFNMCKGLVFEFYSIIVTVFQKFIEDTEAQISLFGLSKNENSQSFCEGPFQFI